MNVSKKSRFFFKKKHTFGGCARFVFLTSEHDMSSFYHDGVVVPEWVDVTFAVAGESRVRYAAVNSRSTCVFGPIMDAFFAKHVSAGTDEAIKDEFQFYYEGRLASRHTVVQESPEGVSLMLVTVYPPQRKKVLLAHHVRRRTFFF